VRVKVLFFGQLKDIAGRATDGLDLKGGETLEDVFNHYAAIYPRLNELRSSIVIACNQNFAEASTEVMDGDESPSCRP